MSDEQAQSSDARLLGWVSMACSGVAVLSIFVFPPVNPTWTSFLLNFGFAAAGVFLGLRGMDARRDDEPTTVLPVVGMCAGLLTCGAFVLLMLFVSNIRHI